MLIFFSISRLHIDKKCYIQIITAIVSVVNILCVSLSFIHNMRRARSQGECMRTVPAADHANRSRERSVIRTEVQTAGVLPDTLIVAVPYPLQTKKAGVACF